MRFSGLIVLMLSVLLLCFAPAAFAEQTDATTEIVTEATYQMGDSDTPAKAEEQALLRAKRNAIEQVSPLAVPLEKIATLPAEALDVTVLDKKRTLSGDRMTVWVQIKAVVNTGKLEAALNKAAFPEEYYCETVTYAKGDNNNASYTRMWISKNGHRSENVVDGNLLTYIFRPDKNVAWYMRNNKYYEAAGDGSTGETPQTKEEILGSETIGGVAAQKKLETFTFKNGLVFKTISWIDPATNFPLRKESSSSINNMITITEYRNIKIGPQNPALFEFPAGYARCASLIELYDDNSAATAAAAQNDPLQNALDGAAQTVINNAINSLFNF